MSMANRRRILRLFKYAQSIGSDLSGKILEANKSTMDIEGSKSEHISVDLVELISLVDPEFVVDNLKIDTIFME